MAAEDIVTEALIKLWERMKIGEIDPVAPYLFTILKNDSLDYLKHQKVKQITHDSITKALSRELEIRMISLETSDPTYVFSAEVQQIIHNTLDSMPQRTKEVFLMSRFENKSHKEIAQLFNISVKGVDYHILQSVKELRVALRDYLPFVGALTFLN
jgi:RNA polymerase sigma-70 factor (ECF subfamily)